MNRKIMLNNVLKNVQFHNNKLELDTKKSKVNNIYFTQNKGKSDKR